VFRWRLLDERDADVGSSTDFPDRDAAESWLGAEWSELVGRGVEEVTLVELSDGAERDVYRMSLRET
jgi:hypothetical protein